MEPLCVLISDIHFNLSTLEVASKALEEAVDASNRLYIPLIIAGDLHDTKANMRAECIEAILNILVRCVITPYVIVGNHDKVNEKGDAHALEFIRHLSILIEGPFIIPGTKLLLLPYYSDVADLRVELDKHPDDLTLIMHQGLNGSDSGEYYEDRTALNKEDVARFRVISGHYHHRQTIKTRPLPRCIAGSFELISEEHQKHAKGIGTWDYIGNPYTLGFGEASHPPKGFQILMDDGTLEFVELELRRHVVLDLVFDASGVFYIPTIFNLKPNDKILVKARGTPERLERLDKASVSRLLGSADLNFRLDLIPDEVVVQAPARELSNEEMLDELIDSLTNTTDARKSRVKDLWRLIINEGE